MINGKTVIGFIPIRGGSKGVPQKNIRELCKKPLFYWVIKELINTPEIDSVVVSTDDVRIENLVRVYFPEDIVIHKRSEESANDINHWELAVNEYTKDNILKDDNILVMAQVTSPFTRSIQITEALQAYIKFYGLCSLVTCTRIHRFIWDEMRSTPLNYNQLERPRRQDFKGTLVENGAFCINSVKNVREFNSRLCENVITYEMKCDYTALEIDTEDDFYYAEYLFRKYILCKRLYEKDTK